MKKGGGKIKGGRFERSICVKLSLWVSHGERKDLYWRSAMSGGRATVAKRKGDNLKSHAGDIIATAPEGHVLTDMFYFELKHHKNLQIDSFLIKDTGTLAKFWRDTIQYAKQYGKSPVLIAKQNNMPALVIVNPGMWGMFQHPILMRYIKGKNAPVMTSEVHLLSDILATAFQDPRWRPSRKGLERLKLIRRG